MIGNYRGSWTNQQSVDILKIDDPFALVAEDLKKTKEFAINSILKTEYKQLEDPALYNLNLKGKNFRSAILFMLARSIYNS
jgi:geranylgeranyl pyrophosphate synthase